MSAELKVFTYWETAKGVDIIPPYILCGLVSAQRAFGDRFLLITRRNLADWVDFDFLSTTFIFAAQKDPVKDQISKIVAKSDFLRFKFIAQHGGVWLDADSILRKSFIPRNFLVLQLATQS